MLTKCSHQGEGGRNKKGVIAHPFLEFFLILLMD